MNAMDKALELITKLVELTKTKMVNELLRENDNEVRFMMLNRLDALSLVNKQLTIELDKYSNE